MTYVGQNFGAGDRERVHESIHKGLLIHLTTSALFSVIIFSGRYPMMHLFVGDDPTVIAIGAGAMTVSHANDSYFWVVTNFGEMTPQDGYKTQTLGTLVIGVVSIIGVFIVSLFLH